jgi:hypothetical protein
VFIDVLLVLGQLVLHHVAQEYPLPRNLWRNIVRVRARPGNFY